MFTIRQEQTEAFRQHHLQKFEDEMVEHLKGFAARLSEMRGEECIRTVIRKGIANAGQYGFTNRGPVRFYIELMFTLGCDFDTDFQYPWAVEILRKTSVGNQTTRADRLFSRLRNYVDSVAGAKKQYILDALHKMRNVDFDAPVIQGEGLDRWIIARLEATYPQKCSYLGEADVRQLVKLGIETANRYGVSSGPGPAMLVGLMFGFGHGVTRDPLYPWVSSTLGDPAVKDPIVRGERLFRKSKLYADHLIAHLEAEQNHVQKLQ